MHEHLLLDTSVILYPISTVQGVGPSGFAQEIEVLSIMLHA